MPKQIPKTLNHFAFFKFTEKFYQLSSGQREKLNRALVINASESSQGFDLYQIYPATVRADILIWTASAVNDEKSAHSFFTDFARNTNSLREYIDPVHVLWGFTKPSQYTKTRSTQEIDPFAGSRKRYLVIYPFTKTGDWYLMSREARQGMMNEHIRIGKEFPEIHQLLLYSFGIQDQEFVVVYETEDLSQFSDLVYGLRETEARRYTLSDEPLFTALYHTPEETLALWQERIIPEAG